MLSPTVYDSDIRVPGKERGSSQSRSPQPLTGTGGLSGSHDSRPRQEDEEPERLPWPGEVMPDPERSRAWTTGEFRADTTVPGKMELEGSQAPPYEDHVPCLPSNHPTGRGHRQKAEQAIQMETGEASTPPTANSSWPHFFRHASRARSAKVRGSVPGQDHARCMVQVL